MPADSKLLLRALDRMKESDPHTSMLEVLTSGGYAGLPMSSKIDLIKEYAHSGKQDSVITDSEKSKMQRKAARSSAFGIGGIDTLTNTLLPLAVPAIMFAPNRKQLLQRSLTAAGILAPIAMATGAVAGYKRKGRIADSRNDVLERSNRILNAIRNSKTEEGRDEGAYALLASSTNIGKIGDRGSNAANLAFSMSSNANKQILQNSYNEIVGNIEATQAAAAASMPSA